MIPIILLTLLKFVFSQELDQNCVDPSTNFLSGAAFDCVDEVSKPACEGMFGDSTPADELAAIALVGKTGTAKRPDGTGQSTPTPFSCMTTDIEAAEDLLKCARHCYLCCRRQKFKCKDADPSFKCKDKKSNAMCLGSLEIMAQKCAGTCGLCDYNGVTFCEDHIPECKDKEFKDMCDDSDPILRNSVRKACPKACGQCSSNVIGGASISPPPGIPPVENNCVDLNGADCEKNILLCENVYYSRLMSSDCRKTCGYCLPPTHPAKTIIRLIVNDGTSTVSAPTLTTPKA